MVIGLRSLMKQPRVGLHQCALLENLRSVAAADGRHATNLQAGLWARHGEIQSKRIRCHCIGSIWYPLLCAVSKLKISRP